MAIACEPSVPLDAAKLRDDHAARRPRSVRAAEPEPHLRSDASSNARLAGGAARLRRSSISTKVQLDAERTLHTSSAVSTLLSASLSSSADRRALDSDRGASRFDRERGESSGRFVDDVAAEFRSASATRGTAGTATGLPATTASASPAATASPAAARRCCCASWRS